MSRPLRFYSTNRNSPDVTLAQALLQGQAPDRGLYLPRTYPLITPDELRRWRLRSYPEVAFAVLRKFTVGVIDEARLRELCTDAYDFEVPLEKVTEHIHVLRLDRGPTASFKDFAARMMARWMGVLASRQTADGEPPGELIVLTATSGDTGSAVAHAFRGVGGVRVVVLFPPAEVSDRQRRQMTTLGGNVTTVAIDGKFDDCQALVKQAFADSALRGLRLTSANSINIGRLLPQCVYYVYAYVHLPETANGAAITVSVPSGNFGNMMGAMLARRMGLPIERVVVATNANDEFPNFLRTGQYQKIVPSRVCISNAMNVGHPSNLARLVDIYGGWMDETGHLREPPNLSAMRQELYAVSIDDERTRATIKTVYEQHQVILEPHGAVGWAGLEEYLDRHPAAADRPAVTIETAHPAKFPEEIQATIGITPKTPRSLAGLETKQEHYERLPAQYEQFRAWLLEQFGQ